jgi:hypothetical protein
MGEWSAWGSGAQVWSMESGAGGGRMTVPYPELLGVEHRLPLGLTLALFTSASVQSS